MTENIDGAQQLLDFIREWCPGEEIESILIYEGDLYTELPAEHRGLFSPEEALDILRHYVLERDHRDERWDQPPVMIRAWLTDTIVYSHDYDGELTFRTMDRNPRE